MLEKPPIQDAKIIACLRENYGVIAADLEFLPLGYDAYAAVYRVTTDDGQHYFLKLRRDVLYEPSISVPRYLRAQGIEQVVAPLPTISGGLCGVVDEYNVLLYPFIDGRPGMEVGLSESQWIAFGAVLKKIHDMKLPAPLIEKIQKETFGLNPKWVVMIRHIQTEVMVARYEDPHEREFAAFWREKHSEIGRIVDRGEVLGRQLQSRSLDFVLCHTDIHTANLLLSPDGALHIVDWDQPIFAPKERDLMFVAGDKAANLFFRGYGTTEVDRLVLAYYGYEWVVQELGDFGERVFFTEGMGDTTKADSVRGFRQLFDPGDVIDAAYNADREAGSS
jgi:spectinomycin phosphotransferase